MTNSHCEGFDDATEILTPHGWVYFTELTEDSLVAQVSADNKTFEFIKPSKLLTCDYDGDLLKFYDTCSTRINMVVTPNHYIIATSESGIDTKYTATVLHNMLICDRPVKLRFVKKVTQSQHCCRDHNLSKADISIATFFKHYSKLINKEIALVDDMSIEVLSKYRKLIQGPVGITIDYNVSIFNEKHYVLSEMEKEVWCWKELPLYINNL